VLPTGLLDSVQIADEQTMTAKTKRVYFRLPAQLAKEIDALVGPRKRSAFIVAAAEQEVRRRKLAASRADQLEVREALERLSIN